MEIAAGQFKAKCLKLMEEVKKYHEEIVITKFGKPVAKLVPVTEAKPEKLYGFLKSSLTITGNIVESLPLKWDSDG